MYKVPKRGWRVSIYLFILSVVVSCSSDTPETSEEPLFRLINAEKSNLNFSNTITETDTFNVLNFEYFYNGSGVGLGDVNGDGLLDVYFGGNMVSSKLFINQGEFTFRDVTDQAGVATDRWCHGISMVDINQDGWLDIYVSTINPFGSVNAENLFFINQGLDENGIPRFVEMAADMGLADSSFATQSAFFDYDLDGDLDMYLLTNSLERFVRSNPIGQHHDGQGRSVDKLYQNTGNNADGIPQFRDVSADAGILAEGWGLGIVVSDINKDGYPDIYVANDFMANDHVYINNQNGTFSDQFRTMLKHQEMNGMGVDMADLNNDGLNEIVVVDMLPEDNRRQKAMFSDVQYDRFQLTLQRNYQPQYVRNVLQLNNGNGTFSDIGFFSGIYATDWSWSPLIADFDNDGWRDIFITNGYVKDVTDLDFTAYAKEADMFGTKEARIQKLIQATNKLEGIDKPNLMFRNNGDLTFTNVAGEWGLEVPSYSNGATYGDLDNDGDLDIITNDINGFPLLFENLVIDGDKAGSKGNNFIRFKLAGPKGNSAGIGATVTVYSGKTIQYAEQNLQRGYKSTVEPYLHFGLGNTELIDSVLISWPGSGSQILSEIKVNQVITLRADEASERSDKKNKVERERFFAKISSEKTGIEYKHEEPEFPDFKVTPLLPRKHSQPGPALCAGDLNGDSLEDFIVGGPAHQPGTIYFQTKSGTFVNQKLPAKSQEDVGMLLFDADKDGDLDLYCVSGSSEFGSNVSNYQDRLYLNDGLGNFTLSENSLPEIKASGSCVLGQDFDKDGDIDLFIGGRITPGSYPIAPLSYILKNDGNGHFSDVTEEIAPGLREPGMVTAGLWTDYDNDGWTDIVVIGEFMPITFFRNVNGTHFEPGSIIDNSSGWWNSITGADLDNDGDTDYVLGNLGLNSIYKASPEEPVCVYAKDFDANGSIDPVLCRFIEGKEYPVHPRETMTSQIVPMKKILRSYEIYGKSEFGDLFSEEMLKDALILKATEFRSAVLMNNGNDGFDLRPLPDEVQFAPLFSLIVRDINQDGNLDIICAGNDYSFEPLSGLYDSGIGKCLLGDGSGAFEPVDFQHSGFWVDGDVKAMITLPVGNATYYITSQNRDSLIVHSISESASTSYRFQSADVYANIFFQDGHVRKTEVYRGDSYLSQSPGYFTLPENADSVRIFDYENKSRTIKHSKSILP